MKTMFLAAAAALGIGIGSAHAGDGDGYSATTLFTSIAGQQAALSAKGNAVPPRIAATDPAVPATSTFVTQHQAGTWLFPPAQFGG